MKHIASFADNVLTVGAASLRAHNPILVEAFERVLDTEGPDAALGAIKAIEAPKFARWGRIIEHILEIHLWVAHLEASLRLYNTRLPDDTLRAIGISPGHWVSVNHNNTYVTLDGLIERAQKLGAYCAAPLRVPKEILVDLKTRTAYLHGEIAKARNPVVHGGHVASIREERFSELYALIGDLPDAKDVIEPSAEWHVTWSNRAHEHGFRVVDEIDAVLGELNSAVKWDRILADAERR